MLNQLTNWHFDLPTALFTVIVAPILLYIGIATKKFVSENIRYVYDGILYYISRAFTRRLAANLTLRRYGRLILTKSDRYLRVPALKDINLDIDTIYVPLQLESALNTRIYDHTNIFEAGNRIRLIGDPGSGKSSIGKRLVRDECVRATSGDHRRFPLLIELRSISIPPSIAGESLGNWLLDLLRQRTKTYSLYEIDRCFDIFSKTSGLLAVLDGLDEVASDSYDRIRLAINGLSEELSKLSDQNIVILTLRTQFHQQVRNHFPEFPVVLSLKRFSVEDIYRFLTRWPFGPSDRGAEIVRIYTNLGDQPALREMCTNPLILSMYVAQDQSRGSPSIPETRTAFYNQVVEELMIYRHEAQVGPLQQRALLLEQRQRIFGRIAFNHLVKGTEATNQIAWNEGIEAVRAVTKRNISEAEILLRELSSQTGLITEERRSETFRFIHLTFCEFFAAFEAVQHRRDGWSALIKAFQEFSCADVSKTRLVEVIPFACALMPPYQRSQALSELDQLANKYVVALSFLETKMYSHPMWREFKDSYQEELIGSSETNWGFEWLSKVHTFLVVCTDAERSHSIVPLEAPDEAGEVAPFFQAFKERSQKPIQVLIQNLAEQDAAAAFRIAGLCGIGVLREMPDLVIEHVNQPAFLGIALKEAEKEPEHAKVWASLFCEAGLRSRSAALQLIGADRLIQLYPVTKSLGNSNKWYLSSIISENLYSDCLAISMDQGKISSELPLLKALTNLKVPYSMRLGRVWYHAQAIIVSFVSLAAYFSVVFTVLDFFIKKPNNVPSTLGELLNPLGGFNATIIVVSIICMQLIIVYICVRMIIKQMAIRLLYCDVFNVDFEVKDISFILSFPFLPTIMASKKQRRDIAKYLIGLFMSKRTKEGLEGFFMTRHQVLYRKSTGGLDLT